MTVKTIVIEADNIFVRACFSSSILIILFNVRKVRVKVKNIDETLNYYKTILNLKV